VSTRNALVFAGTRKQASAAGTLTIASILCRSPEQVFQRAGLKCASRRYMRAHPRSALEHADANILAQLAETDSGRRACGTCADNSHTLLRAPAICAPGLLIDGAAARISSNDLTFPELHPWLQRAAACTAAPHAGDRQAPTHAICYSH
jgi:hypothetical protein